MKFINYLESIAGVGVFPLVSLGIFFVFFVILSIWALKVSKEHLNKMANIPFEKSTDSENN